MKILFHGNFESTADWNFLGPEWRVFPLWETLKNASHLRTWEELSKRILGELGEERVEHAAGYSLGGRVLLNLIDSGWNVNRASFISTHPGLESDDLRAERIALDLLWKERVLNSDWSELFLAWNNQEIFTNDLSNFELFSELEIYRQEIAYAFDLLSLGRMKSFKRDDAALKQAFSQMSAVQWICGDKDQKFCELGSDFSEQCGLSYLPFHDASHRIHKRDPMGLMAVLNSV
jgi:2-succinyl-6-hydroxy-2,4-cyclohexadiene-1-carboxylate synthase